MSKEDSIESATALSALRCPEEQPQILHFVQDDSALGGVGEEGRQMLVGGGTGMLRVLYPREFDGERL